MARKSREEPEPEKIKKTMVSEILLVVITVVLWTVMSKLFEVSPLFAEERTLWIILLLSITVFVVAVLYVKSKN